MRIVSLNSRYCFHLVLRKMPVYCDAFFERIILREQAIGKNEAEYNEIET